jgi:hypothetical protein
MRPMTVTGFQQILPAPFEQPHDAQQPQALVTAPLPRQLFLRAGERQPPQPRGLIGRDPRQRAVDVRRQDTDVVELAQDVLQAFEHLGHRGAVGDTAGRRLHQVAQALHGQPNVVELVAAGGIRGRRQAGRGVCRILLQPLPERPAERHRRRCRLLQPRAQLHVQPLEAAAHRGRRGGVAGVPPAAQPLQQVVEAGPLATPQPRPGALQPDDLHLRVAAPIGLPHQPTQLRPHALAGRPAQPRPIGAQHAAAPPQRYAEVVQRLRFAGPPYVPDRPIGLRQVAVDQRRHRLHHRPLQEIARP